MNRDDRIIEILNKHRHKENGLYGMTTPQAITAIKQEYETKSDEQIQIDYYDMLDRMESKSSEKAEPKVIKDLKKVREQTDDITKSESEVERLRKFVDYVLESEAWGNIDGGDIQDKAVELRLVELRPVDKDENEYGADELYFTKWTPTISAKG